MFWIILGMIVFVLAMAVLVYLYISDRKAEKRSVVEVIGKDLWDEIASEREANLQSAKKFKEALARAKEKTKTHA